MNYTQLIEKATKMLDFSYAPYSHFHVGAALLCQTEDNTEQKIFTGCNIENAAYGPSNCAERTAVFSAVADGERDFVSIMIVGGKNGEIEDYAMPCGICRQVLSEFCGADFKIFVGISERFFAMLIR